MSSALAGLVLAAGAGRRMGRPKALLSDHDGTSWLARSVEVLRGAGCTTVTVVLGAAAEEARGLVPDGVHVAVADDWAEGMGASLRAGLRRLERGNAVLVTLVDLPDVTAEVARRVAQTPPIERHALARAVYAGRPGHPVLLGRDHWIPIADSVAGDSGARAYLAAHGCVDVECGDLATGHDVDEPTRGQRPRQ